MSRRLKPLGIDHLAALPCECAGCVFWETDADLDRVCGSACDLDAARSSLVRIHEEWGECGRVATEDDEVLGVIKYAPSRYFPQAARFPSAPAEPDTVLLACIHIRDDARRHGLGSVLLRAALRDLLVRGERSVQAFACSGCSDMTLQPVMGVEFLLRNGFTVARPHPVYPLMRLDLRTLVTWADNLEAVLQSLRIPLGSARRVPSPSIKVQEPDR